MIAQRNLSDYSILFRDTINICRSNTGSIRGQAFDSIINLNSLKGISKRRVKKIFGAPYIVREPNEPNLCKVKEDLIWVYPISCGCYNEKIRYETCDFAFFCFLKGRLVCVDGWHLSTFKAFH